MRTSRIVEEGGRLSHYVTGGGSALDQVLRDYAAKHGEFPSAMVLYEQALAKIRRR